MLLQRGACGRTLGGSAKSELDTQCRIRDNPYDFEAELRQRRAAAEARGDVGVLFFGCSGELVMAVSTFFMMTAAYGFRPKKHIIFLS